MKKQIKNFFKSIPLIEKSYKKIQKIRIFFNSIYFKNVSSFVTFFYKNKSENSQTLEKGFIYIVFGKQYFEECLKSIELLKKYTDLPIHVFTDYKNISNKQKKHLNSFTIIPKIHIRSKVDYIFLSPFKKTIYLDSDIIISNGIDELFELLNYYDFLATLDTARKREYISKLIPEYKKIPYAFGEINGGLIGFNQKAKENILKIWPSIFYKYYEATKGWDQPSLRILLWKYKASLYILPPEFNVRSNKLLEKIKNSKQLLGEHHMSPRVYHMHIVENIQNLEAYPDIPIEEILSIAKESSYEINY